MHSNNLPWPNRITKDTPPAHSLMVPVVDRYVIPETPIGNPWLWVIFGARGVGTPDEHVHGLEVSNPAVPDLSGEIVNERTMECAPQHFIYKSMPLTFGNDPAAIVAEGFFRICFGLEKCPYADSLSGHWNDNEPLFTAEISIDGSTYSQTECIYDDESYDTKVRAYFQVLLQAHRSALLNNLQNAFKELNELFPSIQAETARLDNQIGVRDIYDQLSGLAANIQQLKAHVEQHADQTEASRPLLDLIAILEKFADATVFSFLEGASAELGKRFANLIFTILTLLAILYWVKP